MTKKVRRYFPDFLIKVKTKEGKLRTHLIEVKPTKDMRPPVGGKGKKKSTVLYEMKTYQMNRDKFASARKWCDDRNIIFDIWTEKHSATERIIHSTNRYTMYNPNNVNISVNITNSNIL